MFHLFCQLLICPFSSGYLPSALLVVSQTSSFLSVKAEGRDRAEATRVTQHYIIKIIVNLKCRIVFQGFDLLHHMYSLIFYHISFVL